MKLFYFVKEENNPPLLRVYYEARITSMKLEEEARQIVLLLDYWAM